MDVLEELKKKPSFKPAKQIDLAAGKVIVAGLRGIPVRLSGCCSPLPGDGIIGFVTRGRGVSIHKKGCVTAKQQEQEESMRVITVEWDYGQSESIPVLIEVKSKDRQGIFMEIVKSISNTQTNIRESKASTDQRGNLVASFEVDVEHLDQLKEILSNLKQIPDVYQAHRIKN